MNTESKLPRKIVDDLTTAHFDYMSDQRTQFREWIGPNRLLAKCILAMIDDAYRSAMATAMNVIEEFVRSQQPEGPADEPCPESEEPSVSQE